MDVRRSESGRTGSITATRPGNVCRSSPKSNKADEDYIVLLNNHLLLIVRCTTARQFILSPTRLLSDTGARAIQRLDTSSQETTCRWLRWIPKAGIRAARSHLDGPTSRLPYGQASQLTAYVSTKNDAIGWSFTHLRISLRAIGILTFTQVDM